MMFKCFLQVFLNPCNRHGSTGQNRGWGINKDAVFPRLYRFVVEACRKLKCFFTIRCYADARTVRLDIAFNMSLVSMEMCTFACDNRNI